MEDEDRYTRITLRIPKDLHARIAQAADATSKSQNAEIVARLQASFAPGGHGQALLQLHAQGSDGRNPASIGRQLEQLPSDLSTQYGLHLYNTELKVVQSDLEVANKEFQPLYKKLQQLLSKEDGPEGPKMRASEAVEATRRRISELTNQVEALNQTISNIHLYRKVEGLPELRNVREVSVSVRVS